MTKRFKAPITVLTVIYAVIMLSILIFRTIGRDVDFSYGDYILANVNLIPFGTISNFLSRLDAGTINRDIVYRNLIGNVVLFIPLGLIFPYFVEKCRKLLPCLMYSALTVAIVEVLQLLTRQGSFDVDDIILNTLGALIGFGIFSVFKRFLIKE